MAASLSRAFSALSLWVVQVTLCAAAQAVHLDEVSWAAGAPPSVLGARARLGRAEVEARSSRHTAAARRQWTVFSGRMLLTVHLRFGLAANAVALWDGLQGQRYRHQAGMGGMPLVEQWLSVIVVCVQYC